MSLLCKLGWHSWEDLGLASFGRGKLRRCKRCGRRDRIEIDIEELEGELRKEVRTISSRIKKQPPVFEQVKSCPRCNRPFFWTVQRCPDCNAS